MRLRPVFAALAALSVIGPAVASAQAAARWAALRRRMVEEDIVAAGVSNPRVIAAMRSTPRHEFVPASQRTSAYFDMALPIGEAQTISPPFVVAYMTEKLDPQPTDKVLEIGTGSGYQAAVLAGLVKEVYTIEIVEPLGRRAAAALRRLGYKNVRTKLGDGYQGWPEHAPFDKIIVTCSPENIPQPLVEQLQEGGRLIIPLGERFQQTLYLYRKVKGQLEVEALEPTMFVPMIGAAEQERVVQPDLTRPALANGGFERTRPSPTEPDGWYYVRQARVEADPQAPEGANRLTMTNSVPGRHSQALQAFGVDGRKVRELEVSLWVRANDVRGGRSPDERPRFLVTFFDEERAPAGEKWLGPWDGTFAWTEERARLEVPESARLAVVAIGLLGGTGEVSFDSIELEAARLNSSVLPP